MCRFTVYLGPPLRLSTLLLDPSHSLIRQSYEAAERAEPLNGDGFGVGWYAPEFTQEPAVFRSVSPAWSNRNLKSLAKVVASPCILAHVRAATPGMVVSQTNCHPFQWQRILFMHNGHVGDFGKIRRRLLASLSDEAFNLIQGSTDTEHLFAVLVDELMQDHDPQDALPRCLHRAVRRVLGLVRTYGDGTPSNLNLAVADGDRAVVCRYTDAPDRPPETLYYLGHELYAPAAGATARRRQRETSPAFIVASERLTENHDWKAVPRNHMIALDREATPRCLSMSGPELVETELSSC
ncbi:MAG: class II glutamine amidotransferase [Myxococcales bacterium]|nr:class II glutamine amidotransferase [Myxococcales bacterium]